MKTSPKSQKKAKVEKVESPEKAVKVLECRVLWMTMVAGAKI